MNWRLIFSGLKSPAWTIYAVLGVLLAIGLSIWLLRLERRLVSRTVGWTLLSLRILVLLTLLMTLLQPVLTKRFDVSQRGKVIVAIDGSLSMETQDRHASLGEKLRWAQALGMLGNEETRPLIDAWVVTAESGQEPNWLGGDAPPSTPAEQSLSDARARQVTESLNELSEMPRVEFVRRLLQSKPNELLDQLDEVMPIDIRLFASEQQASVPARLAAALQSDRADLIPGATDALQLLTSLTSEEGAGLIRGVILISDGRQTAAGDVTATAQRLASLQVPVYSVPIGSRLPPRDLSIAAVESPEAVFLNDKAQIRAVIGTSGFEGEPLTVRLKRGDELVSEQTVTPASDSVSVTFDIPSDKAGRFDYRVETGTQPGELRDDNNGRDINLQVVDNKARVMLVEGDARWEFRYLKNLLDRDKQVEPLTVLLHQPFLDLLNQPYIPSKLPEIEAFREQLAKTDLLIVGDIDPLEVEPGIWEMIEQAVTRDGLTLMVIPGRSHMPHEFQSSVLTSLLPVTETRQRLAEMFRASARDAEQTSFRLSLGVDAAALPMFQLSADPADRFNAFASLPGHPWIYGGIAKPGATVWATATIPGVDVAAEPTIVHHDYGFGQVVWMGLDSTWRWRRRAGDEWHYRFWGQLIRWAARNKAAAGNDNVRMSLSDVVIDESESVEAMVRWNPKLLPQLAGASVEIVATLVEPPASLPAAPTPERSKQPSKDAALAPDDVEHVTVLTPSADAAERYTGRLPRLSAGAWKVRLRVTGGNLAENNTIESEVLVRKQMSQELANVSCNRALLTQLAELTNGAVVEPYEAERLISLVQPKDRPEEKLKERTLWDHWLVLLIFFTLLTSEWVLRKLNGLP
ncbi:MAG: hypothetical protein H7Z17_20185 [Fuerstia sp.]|nr:hypothetical protein [Fuerstiella sp.]